MSNYTITTNFASKDTLISGNPLKLIKGADFTTEFTNVATAITSKQDSAYTPPGTGAVPTTVAAKLAQILNVFDFMTAAQQNNVALNIGSIDVTAAIQAAITALSASGGLITLPQGVYLVSSVAVNKSVTIAGVGAGASVIKPANAASHVFDVTTSQVIIQGLGFNFGPTQTGGSYINLDVGSSQCIVQDCYMLGWFVGMQCNGGGTYTIRDTIFSTGVPTTGSAISVTGAVGGIFTIDNVLVTNPAGANQQPANGLYFNGAGNCNINVINSQFVQCLTGCSLSPAAGQTIADAQFVNVYFDHCITNGCLIQPTNAAGAVVRTVFDTCWFGSTSGASGKGLVCTTTTFGGTIDGVTLNNCTAPLNTLQGVVLGGSGTKNVQITGGFYAGNTTGILADAVSTDGMSINGAKVGPWGSVAGNSANGIQILAGTANNFTIANCDLRGNTGSGLVDGSSGTGRLKVNNKGYNPIGTVGITVTASPFTYTAGDTPEIVYINGGTVSLVAVQGASVFQQTNCSVRLSPGSAAVVTYTVAPGMATTKE